MYRPQIPDESHYQRILLGEFSLESKKASVKVKLSAKAQRYSFDKVARNVALT